MLFDENFHRTLEQLVLLSRRLQTGHLHGERPTPRSGASLEFHEYRNYTEGDDLRYVDWNVFARLGQLHFKQFAAERDLHVLVAVDVSASMEMYGKRFQALRVAAALGTIALARGDTLTWTAFSDRAMAGASRLRGPSAGIGFLKALEAAPAGGRTRLTAAATEEARSCRLVVVVSDFCDREAREALRRLRPRTGAVVALHVTAAEELNPPLSGPMRLVDSETGEEADVEADEGVLERYGTALRERWDGLERHCAAESVPYLRIAASAPLRDVVAALLRPGGALARR